MSDSGEHDGQSSLEARLEALSYLVEALIIGQWARSRDPLARARSDTRAAKARLEQPQSALSAGARTEVLGLLRRSLARLESESTEVAVEASS